MTLNITLLTQRTIYQSADFRLTDLDTRKAISDTSTKLVSLHYDEWDGFVSYTGIGRWDGRDTSELIVDWLTGLHAATPAEVATRISQSGTEWLGKIAPVRGLVRHTFILAAVRKGRPQLAVISNFEDVFGRNDAAAGPSLTIFNTRFRGRPIDVVTGWKPAVTEDALRPLRGLLRNESEDPARIRRMLTKINADAADSDAARGMISRECSVVSVRADGQGWYDTQGSVLIRSLSHGVPFPDPHALLKQIGLAGGHLVGMTFASTKPRMVEAACQPQTVVPEAGDYSLHEARHSDFVSCRAIDVSDGGLVVGDGNPPGKRGDYILWTSQIGGEAEPRGLMATAGWANRSGEVAATARMRDGSQRAVRWKAEAPVELECFRGRDSGARAINSAGLIVGWVCIDAVSRGQNNFRPAAWPQNSPVVLEHCGCDWGEAVDVNDAGIALVVGFAQMHNCVAILWDTRTGTTQVIGGIPGVFPTAIASDGTVLGTISDQDGNSVAHLAKPGSYQWEKLGTAPGFYATARNDAGDVVGALKQHGFEKPWLRRTTGEIVWLPYFDHHWCRPLAINEAGVVVGEAKTDHGTHALIWVPDD